MEQKTFCFSMTSREWKKWRGFAAFCYAATLWQILVIVWFLLCELLVLVAKLSPKLGETWDFWLLVWGTVFLLLMLRGYVRLKKATGELEKSVFVLKCSLMPNYMRFYSDASPGMDHLVHYGDVHRLLGVGRNLFFWFTWEKMAMYQIIPSAAFESYQEYRQVKADIKRRIKQQGSGKQKSVLGSFFGGAFSLWLDYIKAVVKALAVVMAVLLCIGLVGTVIKKMKG